MLLPVHPQPYPEELLSSWMVRLALENGWHLHTFYKEIIGYTKPIWTRDADKYDLPNLIECLSAKTGVLTERIQQLSLQSYNGTLFHGNPKAAYLRWILPLGIYHRRRKLLGLQFCPLCLREQPNGYYRKYWRVAFYTFCHKHNVLLLNECPMCRGSVEFHRTGIGYKTEKIPQVDIALCHSCGFDLRNSPTDQVCVTQGTKRYEQLLNQFINKQNEIPNGLAMPLVFYEGLRYIIKMLLHPYSKKFRSFYLNKFTDIQELEFKKNAAYETLSLKQRFHVTTMACWLIIDWPYSFIEMSQRKLLFRSAISDDFGKNKLPYWIEKEIRLHLSDQAYMPNDSEVTEAIRHLQKSNVRVNASAIGKLMGISIDAASRLLKLTPTIHHY